METNEHQQHEINQNYDSWLNRHRWLGYGVLIVIAYYLLTEHRAHVLAYLPFLLLAACPLMHLFMHGGHHKHDDHRPKEEKRS